MKIAPKAITLRELTKGYRDDGEGGVVGYNGKLDIRPPYQREYVYKGEPRNAVIDTALKGFPLNVMYWAVRGDGNFEIIDGQQRTIALCQYVDNQFSVKYDNRQKEFHSLPADIREKLLDYELTIYVCEGEESEKLNWFRIVNIAGVKLKEQELLNATYVGPWLADAKKDFSRSGCRASGLASDYLKGSPIQQDYLETAIKWISDGDIEGYMSRHQYDKNAEPLWAYFKAVIAWVETTFKVKRSTLMEGLDWGGFYRSHKNDRLDPDAIEAQTQALILNDEVQKKSGIYAYILTGGEHHLNLRSFSDSIKQKIYQQQNGICPQCDEKFAYADMQGDHIKPWHKGGRTEEANCQMLCRPCNARKGGR